MKYQNNKESNLSVSKIIFVSILVLVLFGLVGSLVYVFVFNNQNDASPKIAQTEAVDDSAPMKTPLNINKDGSFTFSKNGGGIKAEIPQKPVLDIYNDFICPACGYFEREYGDTIKNLVNSGDVNIHFHPLAWFDRTSPLSDESESPYAKDISQGQGMFSDMYSSRSAAAAYYIMSYAPDKYFDFVESMYKIGNQPCEGFKDNGSQCVTQTPATRGYYVEDGTNDKIASFIEQAGISSDIAQKAANSGEYLKYAQYVSSQAMNDKAVTSTPTLKLNGKFWPSSKDSVSSGVDYITPFWGSLSQNEFADFVKNYK